MNYTLSTDRDQNQKALFRYEKRNLEDDILPIEPFFFVFKEQSKSGTL